MLCRLVNRSGLRLSYWVDGPQGRSNVFYINSWEEGPLQVEPLEKTVVLTDTQLQVRLCSLTIQGVLQDPEPLVPGICIWQQLHAGKGTEELACMLLLSTDGSC